MARHVDEHVAAVVGEEPLGGRRGGLQPAGQQTHQFLHRHLDTHVRVDGIKLCVRVDGIKVQLWEAITLYRTRISENGLRGHIELGLLL